MKRSSSHFVKACASTLAVLDGNYFTNLLNKIISFDYTDGWHSVKTWLVVTSLASLDALTC